MVSLHVRSGAAHCRSLLRSFEVNSALMRMYSSQHMIQLHQHPEGWRENMHMNKGKRSIQQEL